jgi:hypothetical protein
LALRHPGRPIFEVRAHAESQCHQLDSGLS